MIVIQQRHLTAEMQLHSGDVLIQDEKMLLPQHQEMPAVWYMNGGAPVIMKWNREQMQAYWQRSGLIGSQPLHHNRFFKVTIFHFQLMQLIRLPVAVCEDIDVTTLTFDEVKADYHYTDRALTDKLLQQVVKVAIASLYVLALEVGEVIVQLSGDGIAQPVIASHHIANSAVFQTASQQFKEKLTAEIAHSLGLSAVMLGADPEVAIVNEQQQLVAASQYFGESKGTTIGTDSLRVKGKLIYPLLEFRPKPAQHPAQMVKQMHRLLLYASKRIDNREMRLVAGAMPMKGIALGGHIHLSGVPFTSRLLRLLDGVITIPLTLIEAESGRQRRPRYGRLGDYRMQSYGGFEYRTLPSWLISPMVTKAVFALTMLCAEEALRLDTIPQLSVATMDAYYKADYEQLRMIWPTIKLQMTSFARYHEFRSYIDPLIAAVEGGKRWDEAQDIRVKWQI